MNSFAYWDSKSSSLVFLDAPHWASIQMNLRVSFLVRFCSLLAPSAVDVDDRHFACPPLKSSPASAPIR